MSRALILAAVASLAIVPVAAAQDYPERPVRIVVPYNAGGTVDFVGRVLAEHLSEHFGQQFVVENRPGASGSIGAQSVLAAAADGYTLFMTSVTSNAITTGLDPEAAGYDLIEDFVPAGIVGRVPLLLVAANDIPAESAEDLIAYANEQSQPLAYASSGVGSTEHLGAVLFGQIADVELLHVPYTGGAPAMADVVAGRVPLMVATVSTALPQIQANAITPVVIALEQRIDALPDVPSAPEAGLEGFDVASVYGLLAPVDVDPAIISTLNDAIAEIAADEAFSTTMLERGIISSANMSGTYAEFFQADVEKWHRLVESVDFSEQ
ncbi:MAG: tripartite tricarboxylate transporter substrate binding protein [Azospirillaceae bacterium]